MSKHRLETHPLNLGPGAAAVVQPEFTGEMSWYQGYGERHGHEGAEARLVSMHRFDADWEGWEMHPAGTATAVFLTAGMGTEHRPRER